jgi:hypothetical protein
MRAGGEGTTFTSVEEEEFKTESGVVRSDLRDHMTHAVVRVETGVTRLLVAQESPYEEGQTPSNPSKRCWA